MSNQTSARTWADSHVIVLGSRKKEVHEAIVKKLEADEAKTAVGYHCAMCRFGGLAPDEVSTNSLGQVVCFECAWGTR